MKQLPISRFEALARRLVEGSFRRLSADRLAAGEIAVAVAKSLEESHLAGRGANAFLVRLHPHDYRHFSAHQAQLRSDLAAYVSELARQVGLQLANSPSIELAPDETVPRRQVRIEAGHRPVPATDATQIYSRRQTESEALAALTQLDAFLILEGKRHVPLDKPVLTLGRRTDNDIILDSATVSRLHAQIRWRYGRFVLYDVSHRGRTRVNNEQVAEHVLQPGDVIAISDVLLIYGEGQTQRLPGINVSGQSDEPTQFKPPANRSKK